MGAEVRAQGATRPRAGEMGGVGNGRPACGAVTFSLGKGECRQPSPPWCHVQYFRGVLNVNVCSLQTVCSPGMSHLVLSLWPLISTRRRQLAPDVPTSPDIRKPTPVSGRKSPCWGTDDITVQGAGRGTGCQPWHRVPAVGQGAGRGTGCRLWHRVPAVVQCASCGTGCRLWHKVPAVAQGAGCGADCSAGLVTPAPRVARAPNPLQNGEPTTHAFPEGELGFMLQC